MARKKSDNTTIIVIVVALVAAVAAYHFRDKLGLSGIFAKIGLGGSGAKKASAGYYQGIPYTYHHSNME